MLYSWQQETTRKQHLKTNAIKCFNIFSFNQIQVDDRRRQFNDNVILNDDNDND